MSFDHRERNGARIGSLNMEKSRIFRERFLTARRTVLKKNEIDFRPSDEALSRSTVWITRPLR